MSDIFLVRNKASMLNDVGNNLNNMCMCYKIYLEEDISVSRQVVEPSHTRPNEATILRFTQKCC